MKIDLSGQWTSTYHYHDGSDSSAHLLEVTHKADLVRAQSKSQPDGSVVSLELDYDAETGALTGIWKEKTAKNGKYKGMVFKGAVQFLLNDAGNHAQGVWVGFNTDISKINTGAWTLER